MNENRRNCRNCGEALGGQYCSHCGQREGRGDLSFGAVLGELLDDVISWDSRFWRTLLPLMFRPGFLTAEFIVGRRARYVSPFRLYLIVSFLLFLVISLLAGGASVVQTAGDIDGAGEDTSDFAMSISLAREDSPQWLKDLDERLEQNADKLSDDPRQLIQSMVEYLPQMMFLLLPVFALLLKFCYLFSPFHYLQHLVFTLHVHSFVYLLYLFGQLAHFWFQGNAVTEAFPFLVLVYLPLALMRTYKSSLAGAIGKTLFILVADGILLIFSFAAVTIIALALL
tara:strand:+ start:46073 stop:46921 length:849 start_codon:yes stop_codon:yes gene_type:complete